MNIKPSASGAPVSAEVCDLIASLAHLTTVDAMNIITALQQRQARTPLQQQGRADVDKVLSICAGALMVIWTEDKQ
jgi:hypothetical protein